MYNGLPLPPNRAAYISGTRGDSLYSTIRVLEKSAIERFPEMCIIVKDRSPGATVSINIIPVPDFEHHQGPEAMAVVFFVFQVFLHQLFHIGRLKIAALRHPFFRQRV